MRAAILAGRGERAFGGGALVAEVRERGENVFFHRGMSADDCGGDAKAFELVAQLEHHALCSLLADTRDLSEGSNIIAADGCDHLLRLHAAQYGDRELGTDSADGDEPLEQFFFLRTKEAVKRERIFADVRVNVQRDFAAGVGELGKSWDGNGDLVADAINVYNGMAWPLGEDASAQVSDHGWFILAVNRGTAYQEKTWPEGHVLVESRTGLGILLEISRQIDIAAGNLDLALPI